MTELADLAAAQLRCSFAAEARGDALAGTAAPSGGFFLVEQPGAWGRLALVSSALDPAVGAALSARAVSAGLRALLIRRPGRSSATSSARRWALVDSTPGSEAIRWGTFTRDEELLEVPLDGSTGELSDRPAYLVCTHGRHDACCAIRGRPIAAGLAAEHEDEVWECSHVGGDRFAANLVTLPHGLYYGRVDVAAAQQIASAQEHGEVALPWLRGRTTFAPPAQAAQHLARVQLGLTAINALNPRELEPLHEGRWTVRLAAEPSDLLVTIATMAAGPSAFLTCAATHAAHPPTYRLERMQPHPSVRATPTGHETPVPPIPQ